MEGRYSVFLSCWIILKYLLDKSKWVVLLYLYKVINLLKPTNNKKHSACNKRALILEL